MKRFCVWGTLSGINKPQVFVERGDAEKALDFLDAYEDHIRERQPAPTDNQFCHHCGEQIELGATSCAACGQSLDSSNDAEEDRSDDHAGSVTAEQDGPNGIAPHEIPSESLATFRSLKKPLAWMVVIFLAGTILFQVSAAKRKSRKHCSVAAYSSVSASGLNEWRRGLEGGFFDFCP